MNKEPHFIYFIISENPAEKTLTKFIAWELVGGEYEKHLKKLATEQCKVFTSQKISIRKFGKIKSKDVIFLQVLNTMLAIIDVADYAKEKGIPVIFRHPTKAKQFTNVARAAF